MTKWERVAAAKAGDKRWCTACGEDRIDNLNPLGRCPACRTELAKIRARRNARERMRKWRAQNHERERERERGQDRMRKWRAANPERERRQQQEQLRQRRAARAEKAKDAKLGVPLPDAAAVDWGADIELEGDDDGRR